jgi:flagellar basal-body rod protein FlgC
MFSALEVLARGMAAARMRVNVLSSNIANAETTNTPEGGPYKRKDIRIEATTIPGTFSSALDKASLMAPKVTQIVEDSAPPRQEYNPQHPDADANGFVSYPNINVISTMTDLMSASRLYQANISAVETARTIKTEASRILTQA